MEAEYSSDLSFADLEAADRVRCLERVEEEDPGFFGVMRTLTIYGTFSHPDGGGNRGQVGWRLVGMDVQNAYEPPFGYYDRPYHDGSAPR